MKSRRLKRSTSLFRLLSWILIQKFYNTSFVHSKLLVFIEHWLVVVLELFLHFLFFYFASIWRSSKKGRKPERFQLILVLPWFRGHYSALFYLVYRCLTLYHMIWSRRSPVFRCMRLKQWSINWDFSDFWDDVQ